MKKRRFGRLVFIILAGILCVAFLAGAGGYLAFIKYPSIGAQGADALRKVFGDEAVARLESVVFQAQDSLRRLQYQAGGLPQAPWSAAPVEDLSVQQNARVKNAGAPRDTQPPASQPPETSQPALTLTPAATPGPVASLAPQPTPRPPEPTVEAACPPSVAAIGTMDGEGLWSPYLADSFSEKVAACRTFFQPDPERGYAIAAVVAFDLDAVNLHYVLGSQEPVSDVPIDRPGTISPADKQPDVLLAVFNGGFKSRHGHYGVMVDGVTLLPPKDGFGTIALYKDGALRIGAWGQDIFSSPDIVFWRQNGPLLVQDGQINPRTANQSILDWGSTIDGSFPVATWRSALGISADGKTMYFAAGPSLTLQSLAQALIIAGASQAVQLDINNYWVYFGKVIFKDGKPTTDPLFPEWKDNPDRYLHPYIRDFFYVTAKRN